MMKIFKPFLIGICALLVLSGCARQVFVVSGGETYAPVDSMAIFFLGGILQTQHIFPEQTCGAPVDVSRVEFVYKPVDVLIHYFVGIIAPRTASVFCNLQ